MDAYKLFQDYIRLQHQIDEFYHELAVRQNLSDSALLVLWTLTDLGEGCTQRDICLQFSLTKQTVHSSVRKLAKEGFLFLQPGPGREVRVFPTEAGRALIREKILPLKAAEEAASLRMGGEGLSTMLRLTRNWFALFQEEAASIPKTKPPESSGGT
ncbi:MarR family transcriptional regulator [Oscillospiraceae bacterium 38-13]|jgi:DNA-binding MarR family transcriptional regulator